MNVVGNILVALVAFCATVAMGSSSMPPSSLSIGVVVFEGVAPLDYIGPLQYFELLPDINVTTDMVTIGVTEGIVRGSHGSPSLGSPLYATTDYDSVQDKQFDMFIIPGGPGRKQVIENDDFMASITRHVQRSRWTLSICTGGAILAKTGALDGRNATTNKMAFDSIRSQYPKVQWVRHARWVVDDNIWTSSGVVAGLDMTHAFLNATFGASIAEKFAQKLEIVPVTDPSSDPFA